jgi:hypothetical protein
MINYYYYCYYFKKKLFESISVTLASSLANNSPSSGNESMEPYLNDLIGMFYALNENAWRRFAFEVCRQVNRKDLLLKKKG